MSLIVSLIAKLARVDPAIARRAISTAKAQDDADAAPPAEFSKGAGAMVYALAMYAGRRPLHFYIGLFGVVVFPLYLLTRTAEYFYGR